MADQKDPTLSEPAPPPYSAAAPYPASTAPYLASTTPYPVSTAPYPASTAPYPTSSVPHPQVAPAPMYPPNQYPPPAGAPPLNPQNQSYPTPSNPPPAYGMDPPAPEYNFTAANPEDGYKVETEMFTFDDKSVRLGFIRKVYAVLALQMVVTVALSCLFMFHQPTKLFVQEHLWFYLAAYIIFLVLYFVLACCTHVARSYPANLILLSVFTLSLSYMVAAITSYHDTKIVLMVFALTLVVCLSVMLFACQTKYDFTTCGGLLFVLTICLIFFGLFAAVLVPTGHMRMANMAYAGLGALLFMAFLAFDTQLVMGGNKYEIDPEDYVFAAMMLYVDIIYIFLFLLSLFGGSN